MYLLPCSCGAKIPVRVHQAGQTVSCPSCTRSLEVPTLRGLSALERMTPNAEPPLWDLKDGLLFLGSVVFLCGLIFSGYLWLNGPRLSDFSGPRFQAETYRKELDKTTIEGSFQTFGELIRFYQNGMPPGNTPDSIAVFQGVATTNRWIFGGACVALFGALMAAGSRLAPRKAIER